MKEIYLECPQHKKYIEGKLGFNSNILEKFNCHLCPSYNINCKKYKQFLNKAKRRKKPKDITRLLI